MEIPIWVYVTSIIGSFSVGLGIGLKIATKTVTIDDKATCSVQNEHKHKAVFIKKIYTNGQCSDISCYYLGPKKICSLTQSKCKYLT